MILHRYFSSHAFETLKEAKLKTAKISDFNDPFEFLYVSVGKLSAVDLKNFIGTRDSNILLQICNKLLQQKMPGLGLTEQDFETFLKQPEIIEKIAGQWPAIVRDNDLPFERRRQVLDAGWGGCIPARWAGLRDSGPRPEFVVWEMGRSATGALVRGGRWENEKNGTDRTNKAERCEV